MFGSSLVAFLVVGLIAGGFGRLLVPGRDPMGILGTMLLGIVGSFVGGTLFALVSGAGFEVSASGFIGSVIGSVIALLGYRLMRRRRLV